MPKDKAHNVHFTKAGIFGKDSSDEDEQEALLAAAREEKNGYRAKHHQYSYQLSNP